MHGKAEGWDDSSNDAQLQLCAQTAPATATTLWHHTTTTAATYTTAATLVSANKSIVNICVDKDKHVHDLH
jgi:hypothetical protein